MAGQSLKRSLATGNAKINIKEKMTHTRTNKTAQTENVLNGEVILKGWIFGQEQTRLFEQA